jgi:uncharacterized protein involved in response to NO
MESDLQPTRRTRPSASELAAEPFRLLFPLGVLAGVIGVSLWPLHFLGLGQYPGLAHARLMAHGFFGSFVLGFLGTAMPRMLGTHPFQPSLVTALVLSQSSMLTLHLVGRPWLADLAMLTSLLLLVAALLNRIRRRSDLPPPGFLLAGLGLACGVSGLVLGWAPIVDESDANRAILQTRLLYQGFLLLPVLGVGGFIFPGLLGTPNLHEFPEMRWPNRVWLGRAAEAFAAGLTILASFGLEVWGAVSWAHGLRFGAAAIYLFRQVPLRSPAGRRSTVAHSLRTGLALLLAGLLGAALLPQWRVALLHLTYASGLVLVTLAVATRVLFGHSGQPQRLHARNGWLIVAFALLFFGTLTRITGDFLPKILPTHYSYGALMWAGGALLWAWKTLPAVLVADREG